jgi:DNA excision repair protein ERCC-4
VYAATPVDILRTIPGVTDKNVQLVMRRVRDLQTLSNMPLSELADIVGTENGRKIYNYFRTKVSS